MSPDLSFWPMSHALEQRSLTRSVKEPTLFVFLTRWKECMLPIDFFDFGDDMGQTGLPVGADAIIGGIAIAHQGSGKVSKDGLCHIGGAVTVDMKEGEIFIAPKPHEVADSVVSP